MHHVSADAGRKMLVIAARRHSVLACWSGCMHVNFLEAVTTVAGEAEWLFPVRQRAPLTRPGRASVSDCAQRSLSIERNTLQWRWASLPRPCRDLVLLYVTGGHCVQAYSVFTVVRVEDTLDAVGEPDAAARGKPIVEIRLRAALDNRKEHESLLPVPGWA